MIPRKLIRPSLKNVVNSKKDQGLKSSRVKGVKTNEKAAEEILPPERTNREADYYQMLIKNKTQLKVFLKDGNIIEGHLEYYDKNFLRITRENHPNAFIYKTEIKYLCESADE